jgi:hypothetical protein
MRLIVLILVFILNTQYILGQDVNNAFQSLNLPLSSRLAVLNEPISIYDNDIELGIFNPSMLNEGMHNQFSLNFVDYFSDINFVSAAYALPFNKFGTIGISVKSIGYGNFVETDYTSQVLGEFGASEQIVSIGVGKELSERWSVGASVKTLFSNLQNYQSLALGTDFAVAYKKEDKNLSMSLLARNYGKQITTYSSVKENLPFQLDFGISKRLEHLPFRFSINYKNIQKWNLLANTNEVNAENSKISLFSDKLFRHIDFGGELSIGKHIQLRSGYSPIRRQELKVDSYLGTVGFSWGVGIKFSHFTINYGRSTYHLHGSPNYFSFSTDFSKFYKKQ